MEIENILKALKAISDENRLKIFLLLKQNGDMCACKLLEDLNCNQPTLSHHMKVLVNSGLIYARKDWKRTHYYLNKAFINELSDFLKE